MAKQRATGLLGIIFAGLGWPLMLGLTAWVGFYLLIHQGIISSELVRRYFAGHAVEYAEAALFFVGLAALAIKAAAVLWQYAAMPRIGLPAPPSSGNRPDHCDELIATLEEGAAAGGYLPQRLIAALDFVRRKGTADGLDEQLRELADQDAARAHESFALVRMIIWAIPILGFLGTVIGVTMALANLSPEQLVHAPEAAMKGLLGGLSVAFDTTALALSLSIVLMFAMFLTSRLETELLAAVDARTSAEMVGRFQQLGSSNDPQAASIARMAEAVVAATERLVERQALLWKQSIDAAQAQWNRAAGEAGAQLTRTLSTALDASVKGHAAELVKAEHAAADRLEKNIHRLHAALAENAEVMKAQQVELMRQAETFGRAADAAVQIAALERTLNENLAALAGAKNFEDTVMSLSAAIHLLNTRLGRGDAAPPVHLGVREAKRLQDRAA